MTFTLWFMGRPASGKSTLAKRIEGQIRDVNLPVENLDGDEVRKHLHPDLGFTREERALNNRRTAFLCKLLNRNGIVAITAMITPFRDSQQRAREIVEETGDFVLIYVKCPVETAAKRDPKGLYEQAEAGKIDNFTGVSHPFQEPLNAEIIVDTEEGDVEQSVAHITRRLQEIGVFESDDHDEYGFDIPHSEATKIKERLSKEGHLE